MAKKIRDTNQISFLNTLTKTNDIRLKYMYQFYLNKRAKPKHILMSYGIWKDNKNS